MTICLKLEQSVGYYQCGNCGYTYVPKIKAVVLAKHKGRDRKMRCISCSEKNYHKKLLTR